MINKKLLHDFRAFATRPSLLDMAIGIIVGTAFVKVVQAVISDLAMPPINWVAGGLVGDVQWGFSDFVSTCWQFVILAAVVFFMVRGIQKLGWKEEVQQICPYCLTRIPAKATRCAACCKQLPARKNEIAHI